MEGPFPSTGFFDDGVRERANELVSRRVGGEPLQYLTGVAGFRRLQLKVGPGVLIPRPETETVVEHAMGRLPKGGVAVDVGTGSGAIALAIADERPDARVYGTESAKEAFDWALRNRDRLGSSAEMVHGDLLEPLPSSLLGSVDVIVSNPPYIADRERGTVARDVMEHEPHVALFAGSEGTDIIERIIRDSLEWLRPAAWLIFEISPHLQTLVPRLLKDAGFGRVAVHPDLAGRARVVEGQRA